MSERVVPNSTRKEFLSKAIRRRLGQISRKMKFHLAVIGSRDAERKPQKDDAVLAVTKLEMEKPRLLFQGAGSLQTWTGG
jgi:tRNA A37 threonylcarbamoyladenosine dehydratase